MESTQHVLDRIRRPRVHITYDVETGGALKKRELPFVIGVMADLCGDRTEGMPPLKDRKFVEIDRDNFLHIMVSLAPTVSLAVENFLGGDETVLSLDLSFNDIEDFNPLNIAKQSAPLNALVDARKKLSDLLAKINTSHLLDTLLSAVLGDQGMRDDLKKQIDAFDPNVAPAEWGSDPKDDDPSKPLLDRLFNYGRLARLPEHRFFGLESLKEFLGQIDVNQDIASSDAHSFMAQCIQRIDDKLSNQINAILHHDSFQRLEAAWRGLRYLVFGSETGPRLKIRLLNITKDELIDDLEKAIEFDQSQLFKKVYEDEYGTLGGNPYSCLIGDFEFSHHPQDMELLMRLSNVAAAAHAPFIAAASPHLFDLDHFSDLGNPRDLSKIFESTGFEKWQSFRDSEDSRYVSLVLPHILMRLPYGPETVPVKGLNYVENVDGPNNAHFCWGNAAYALGVRIAHAFSLYGWTAAIRGMEGGGVVEDLPLYTFKTTDGDVIAKCPTEISITDRREKELSDLGFISLCHAKGTDYAVFFGAQTTQRPVTYNMDDATANAEISARLPYILCASRFAHYIKVMMRDKVGAFATRDDVAQYLSNWIGGYVLLNDDAPQSAKSKYPLREARIDVYDVPGHPGAYRAVIYLRPHFQLEEFTASIRMVANLPPPATA